MKLISIELENFRPYEGRQKISFSQDPGRNVTVIYGTNGGGKTTLLNAFTWGLYDFRSEDFENRDQLINSSVWAAARHGELVSASVTIEFEHNDKIYTAKRLVQAAKYGPTQPAPRPELTLWVRQKDGSTIDMPNNPGVYLNKILPQRLSRFFFVNGERIETLAKRDSYTEIQDAIKTLLGLESMERAVKHLPTVKQRLRKQLKEDGEIQYKIEDLTRELDAIEAEIEKQERNKSNLEQETKHLKREVQELNLRLTQLSETKELQHSRYRFEAEQKRVRQAKDKAEEDRSALLARNGYLSFLSNLPSGIIDVCERLRQRGELPAPLKRTFIEDLLTAEECICGSHLSPGSHGRARLEEWRSRAGLPEVEASWNTLKGTVETIDEQREAMLKSLQELDQAIAGQEADIRSLDEKLSQIASDLKKLPTEDVVRVEEKRQELLDLINEKSRLIGATEHELKRLEQEQQEKDRQIRNLKTKDETSQRILRRVDAVEDAATALKEILDILSNGVRNRLDTHVQGLFRNISLKNYRPELTPGFELELWDTTSGTPVPATKSTGENMLLSLAFVGALAGEAREAAQNAGFIRGVGGDFPVVMDAVFGNLDDDYRKAVAEFLPALASQVIILTSKAQAGSVVEQELRSRLGKQYVITTHTTKKDVAGATAEIVLNGNSYPYQVIGSHKNGAEITEVQG